MVAKEKEIEPKGTYVSLFSGAGVGCYGFKMENFECIATNELIERRLNVQKFNKKCKYDTGYICGDITTDEIKDKLFCEIKRWKKDEAIDEVDVVIATPPCQGMSVANLKKNNEINRNSLVIESIKIIKEIQPKVFVFENVSAFLKTACIDIDENVKSIEDAINYNLGKNYIIASKIINFKDYGSNSSRTRTLVIGVKGDYEEYISPFDLFPRYRKEKTLRQVIGNMKSLTEFGEISDDIYHFFRIYPEHMRSWISDLKEGESAFDNEDDKKKPHTVVDGVIKINTQKTGDKYKRQYWNKVAPCIHTRNDLLASQNTIHPSDDRVFSIRELMRIMTIPDTFKWTEADEKELNSLSYEYKRKFLKAEEVNIRQSIGEAVPTEIFRRIAHNVKENFSKCNFNSREINKIIDDNKLMENSNLIKYIKENSSSVSVSSLSRIAELSNAKRNDEEAYYTNKSLLNYIYKELPSINKSQIRVLEPSVGVGNFIPYVIDKYSSAEELIIDVVDINEDSINVFKELLKLIAVPDNVHINFIVDDFLLYEFEDRYDLVIGNPPFQKLNCNSGLLRKYREKAVNSQSSNTASYFLEKATKIADNVVMIMPKFLLNTAEYQKTRDYIKNLNVVSIIDFGEKGFDGVKVETFCLVINTLNKPKETNVISVPLKMSQLQKQAYIMDDKMPYWIIYRDDKFDKIFDKMEFDIFDVFRDRQISNSNMSNNPSDVWVIKARNISDDGSKIVHIDGYDGYISADELKRLNVYSFFNNQDVYLTPNMTYYPRVCKLPKGRIVNGSVAILIPKKKFSLSEEDMKYFSTSEYREFYRVARNNQTRSLNVDKTSVFFFGKLKEQKAMKWLSDDEISEFIDHYDYDVRKTGIARWIDQKCTPDVLCTVADCILEFVSSNPDEEWFTSVDIWHNKYTVDYVEAMYKKPNPDEKKARSEYDKYFQQPMEMFAYANILEKEKRGRSNFYKIKNMDKLEYISFRETNALKFITLYNEKVLKDSDIYSVFEKFFENPNKETYDEMKSGFSNFTITHTPVNGKTECNRIFTKVLNPLAFAKNAYGTKDGRLSKEKITRDMLMYNRANFRDIYSGKPKEMTRKEYLSTLDDRPDESLTKYQSAKSKKILKKFNDIFNDGRSEVVDERDTEKAINMHHIFPENEFKEISVFTENLIALTPNQHFIKAHPDGNTQIVDRKYQKVCLLSKVESIKRNLEGPKEQIIYSFDNLKQVLAVGFDNEEFMGVANLDFDDIIRLINLSYMG